jgi:hypothetical protein
VDEERPRRRGEEGGGEEEEEEEILLKESTAICFGPRPFVRLTKPTDRSLPVSSCLFVCRPPRLLYLSCIHHLTQPIPISNLKHLPYPTLDLSCSSFLVCLIRYARNCRVGFAPFPCPCLRLRCCLFVCTPCPYPHERG